MTTKINTTDLRQNETTFEDIAVGSMFTEPECDTPYIKMPEFKIITPNVKEIGPCADEDITYNTITLDGEPYWFDYGDEVTPIKEISITMK